MISLLAIGFGMLVLGLCLMTLHNGMRRAGESPTSSNSRVLMEGLVVFGVGLIALLMGVFWTGLSNLEARVLTDTGAALMYLGVLLLIQWTVLSGQGTERHVRWGAWSTTSIGFVLIVIYIGISI